MISYYKNYKKHKLDYQTNKVSGILRLLSTNRLFKKNSVTEKRKKYNKDQGFYLISLLFPAAPGPWQATLLLVAQ